MDLASLNNWAKYQDIIHGDYSDDLKFYLDEAKGVDGKVLEVACGTGRVYLELLKEGVDIVGFDISERMLQVLRQKARAMGLEPRVSIADMRDFDLGEMFPLIIIPFRSFICNLTVADQLATLRSVKKHMTPGGRLILNFFYPSQMIFDKVKRKEPIVREIDTPEGKLTMVNELYFKDTPDQVLEWTTCLHKGDEKIWEEKVAVALIYKREFEHLLELGGFKKWMLFGGFQYERFANEEQEMVWIVENVP